jgi:hypothetical protein
VYITYRKETAKIKVTAGLRLKIAEAYVADVNANDSKYRFRNKLALFFVFLWKGKGNLLINYPRIKRGKFINKLNYPKSHPNRPQKNDMKTTLQVSLGLFCL